MNHVRNFRRVVMFSCVCLMVACGKDAAGPADDAGNMDRDARMPETPGEPQAGTSGEEGSAGSAGTDAADGSMGEPDAAQDAGEFVPDPDFEGIPIATVKFGTATAGCIERAGEGDTLVLTFTAETPTVQLAAVDGRLQVNGIRCVEISNLKRIEVRGTSADETLIVDFSFDPFPESVLSGEIDIDLGQGADTVAVAGTREMDDVHLGTLNDATVLRVARGLPKIVVKRDVALLVSTGPGDDHIDATGGTEYGEPLASGFTAYGGAGFDMLTGGQGDDRLHGGEDDDLFKTAAAADGGDVYDGGRGIDALTYELRKNVIVVKVDRLANDGEPNERDDVQDSVETLIGGAAGDTLTGGDASNMLIGGPGNDTLNGGNGDDMFLEPASALGSDIMNGGPGFDRVDYAQRSANIRITLCIPAQASCNQGACGCTPDDGEANERDNLVNVEGATTGAGDDKLYGSKVDNLFVSGAGDDELYGEDGDDTLYGEDGNDILVGGRGEDLLDGALGVDTFDAGEGQGDICVFSKTEQGKGCELY